MLLGLLAMALIGLAAWVSTTLIEKSQFQIAQTILVALLVGGFGLLGGTGISRIVGQFFSSSKSRE